jgi:hypothetical protein
VAAIWFRFRAELRTRWRGLVAVALLAGAAGGVTLAAIAGARRTDSAYPRLTRATEAADVLVNPDLGAESKLRTADVSRLPQVRDIARVDGLSLATTRLQHRGDLQKLYTTIAFGSDGKALVRFGRWKVEQGRRPDPRRPNDVMVDNRLARRQDVAVGDTIRGLGFPVGSNGVDPSQVSPSEIAALVRRGELGIRLKLRVVGIGVPPDEIVSDEGFQNSQLMLTPEFRRAHPDVGVPYYGLVVRLRNGAADIPAFRRGVERLVPGEAVAFQTAPVTAAKFDRAVAPYVGALGVFAAVVGLTGLLLVGQALARQSFLAAADSPTLAALGCSHRQLFLLGMLRAALVAAVAAVLAVVAGFALSPLMPLGPARTAEPNPGLSFDALAIGLGALAVGIAVLALAAWPAWRAARAQAGDEAEPRSSRAARALDGAGAPVTAVAGVRMALEPGRGRTAVPVRTTILALGLAVTLVIGAICVAGSIDRLVDTPRLFGWNWDVQIEAFKFSPDGASNRRVHRELAAFFDRSPAVAGWGTAALSDVRLVGVGSVAAVGIEPTRHGVGPTVVSGHLPRRLGEVALGSRTLDAAHTDVGGTVVVRANDGGRRRLRVVGRVVLPGFGTYPGSDKTALGEGFVLTRAAMRTLSPPFNRDDFLVAFAHTVKPEDIRAVERRAARITGADSDNDTFAISRVRRPSDILSYEKVRNTPIVLAVVLALLAMASVVHALVTAVRRRRRDLALLETLGFTRRQVSATVAWQATTVGVIALAFGLPLGIVLGRFAWQALADQLGTVAEPVVPLLAVLVAIPVVLALVNLAAFVPGRMAVRIRPATALRSE